MKYIFLISGLIFSCTSPRKAEKQSSAVVLINEGPWKTNFKNMVFSGILFKFYGQNFASCCLSKDASGTANYDWLNYDTAVLNKTVLISNVFVNQFSSSRGDIEGQKVMMNLALDFRNSKELDSITGIYYKQFKIDSSMKAK